MKKLELKPIKSEQEYDTYLDWVDEQFINYIEPDSGIGNKVEITLLLMLLKSLSKRWQKTYYLIKIWWK